MIQNPQVLGLLISRLGTCRMSGLLRKQFHEGWISDCAQPQFERAQLCVFARYSYRLEYTLTRNYEALCVFHCLKRPVCFCGPKKPIVSPLRICKRITVQISPRIPDSTWPTTTVAQSVQVAPAMAADLKSTTPNEEFRTNAYWLLTKKLLFQT